MNSTLSHLIKRLEESTLSGANVIPWSCPVPSFGDPSSSIVATLGLNPSNREFVDGAGNELDGDQRRFHTLRSLELSRWSDATARHLELIIDSCRAYFSRNPDDGWFRKLDYLISGTKASYYDDTAAACHLDLIPYATSCKWTELTQRQRSLLVCEAGDTLALLLRDFEDPLADFKWQFCCRAFPSNGGCTARKARHAAMGIAPAGAIGCGRHRL